MVQKSRHAAADRDQKPLPKDQRANRWSQWKYYRKENGKVDINNFYLDWTEKLEEIIKFQFRNDLKFEIEIKSKKFNDTVKGLTVYADDKNSKNEFINIYIKI